MQGERKETSFSYPVLATEVFVGLSDGLIIPFVVACTCYALSFGNHFILKAGLLAASVGALAMGLGAYLGARHHHTHKEEENRLLSGMGISKETQDIIAAEQAGDQEQWAQSFREHDSHQSFLAGRAAKAGRNIGIAYLLGGTVPLWSYLFFPLPEAFRYSCWLTLICLFLFGFCKARYTGRNPWLGAARAVLTALLAAAGAWGVTWLFR